MRRLYVLYDHSCGLCCSAARWLREEPQHIQLDIMPAMSVRARRLFPTLCTGAPPGEVVAVSDAGDVYRGPSAWIMCLYALKRRRALAMRLAQPSWRPAVMRVIQLLSDTRLGLSKALHLTPEELVECSTAGMPVCTADACGVGKLAVPES